MYKMKFVFRYLFRNRTTSLINIIGLSLGILTFLLLLLFVRHELAYDTQFSGFENIYRVTTKINTSDGSQHLAIAPLPLKTLLKNYYPEIEETALITELPDIHLVKYNDIQFKQDGFREASPELFNILDYKVLYGDLSTALVEPNSVILTESLARKLMGDDLQLNSEILIDKKAHKITAILKDLPKNSDLQFKALTPGYQELSSDWLDFDGFLYVKFHNKVKYDFHTILDSIAKKQYSPLQEDLEGIEIQFVPQQISKVHFSEELLADSPKGNIKYVYFFTIVAFLILFIACLNYINLSFAHIAERKYIDGICKVYGASNSQLFRYLLKESYVITFFSLFIAMVLLQLFLPLLNNITGKDIPLDSLYSFWFLGSVLLVFLGVIMIISGLPNIIPSLYQRKSTINKSIKKTNLHQGNYRGGLVVIQFAFTISLIICLVAFQRQMNFVKNKNLGFELDNVLVIDTPDDSTYNQKIKQFADHLNNLVGIDQISTTYGGSVPGVQYGGMKAIHATEIDGEMKQFIVSFCDIDEKYLGILGIEIIEGEGFSNYPYVNENKCLINETYARVLGISDDPIGKPISETEDYVAGVVKDFHFLSPHSPIEPICFRYAKTDDYTGQLFVKMNLGVIEDVKRLWKETIPDHPFYYTILKDSYNSQYSGDKNLFTIVWFFTVLSILIAGLGLAGLIKYTCERRIKEIGIRKVCGAKTVEILSMINKDFIKWLVVAFILACPIAWYVINRWLEGFAYKITISWLVYVAAGLITLLFSILLVSLLSLYSANRNPVETLRYE